MDKIFTSYTIDDRSYVSFVKREIHGLVLQSNFPKNRIAEIDIVLAELSSNLIKHAGHGHLLFRLENSEKKHSALEFLVIDNGPGIADVPRMMKDGVSTSNTLGHGLGSIQRLTDLFQIYSMQNWGTICYAKITNQSGPPRKPSVDLEVRSLMVPKGIEVVCGDGYTVKRSSDHIIVFFADGLGHGPHAHDAVEQAKAFFRQCQETDPVEIVREMHATVRKTRGLVGSVAVLDVKERKWRMCGVGNITTRLYGGMMFKHYMSYNGIIGLNIPNSLKETVVEAERNQLLIMCSDGLRSRWDLTRYPSIFKYDNMLLAAALYKDFNRANDDTSIFIGKVVFDK
jgi:anti-sigma regulatory factor (Ser/Thr protein kinase)